MSEIKLNDVWSLKNNGFDYQLIEVVPEHVATSNTGTVKVGDIIPQREVAYQSFHPTVMSAIRKIIKIETSRMRDVIEYKEFLAMARDLAEELKIKEA